jgi:cytochrome c oxidase subunit 3
VTLALPAAPAPAPRRQLFVGTALAALAGTTLVGGMLAVWLLQRDRVVSLGERFPESYTIPEVATNVMLVTICGVCLFAQWAVYAAKRRDRGNVGLALGLVILLGIAFINAQGFVWYKMGLVAGEGTYAGMFYAITATMVALVAIGVIFAAIAAFRFLGGRVDESELLAAHALYWYFAAAAFAAVWFVVYVTK